MQPSKYASVQPCTGKQPSIPPPTQRSAIPLLNPSTYPSGQPLAVPSVQPSTSTESTAIRSVQGQYGGDIRKAESCVIPAKTGFSNVPSSDNIIISSIATGAMPASPWSLTQVEDVLTAQWSKRKAFAANNTMPIPVTLTTMVSDMKTVYTAATNMPNTDAARINVGAHILGI
jgi:hypothetical protein